VPKLNSLEKRITELQEELTVTRKIKDNLNNFFEDLNEINDFLAKLVALRSIEDIVNNGILFLKRIVDFEECIFLLYNPNNNNYEIMPIKGQPDLEKELLHIIIARDLLDWIMDSRKAVFFPIDEACFFDKGIKSAVYLPLTSSYAPVGFFVMLSNKDEGEFNLEKNHLFQSLMFHITIAIENFQLIESISEMKDFMKDVMENMMNGVITIGLDKKITYINRNAQFMLDIQVANVLHKPYHEVYLPELAAKFDDIISQVMQAGSVIDYEYEQKLSDSIVLPIGISASLLRNREFLATGYVLILRDLSLTREILKLKELDEMKNDFIAKVSHELRTPLTSISSYTDAILDGLADTKEDLDSYLNIIKEESNRLITMVNDILDLSKMEAGKMVFQLTELRLNDIIHSCINTMQPPARKKMQTLVFREENNLLVNADMDKIIQVLLNLLSNAIKFTPENGTIEISVSDQKSKARIAIKDNGIGMSKEEIEKIFDKFHQVENIKHHQKGTGLGMSICREIITNHAGKIWVTSEKAKGSTIFFTLPLLQGD